jgi:hypothetical protein
MSGPGGIGGNRPTNNMASYPSTSPNSKLDVNDPELNEHGRFVAEQQAQAKTVALAGGPQRTAQAQPPGKSFTETMGAAFTAMGAAVTSFFKGLGDRIATIEMPSLPRISLRRQEAAQANAYNPDDMSPKQRGQAQKAADTRLAVIAQLTMIKADGRPISTNEGLAVILNSGPGSALSKEFDKQVKKEFSTENLDYLRDLHSGIHLDADYVAQMKSNLNTTGRGFTALDSALAALKASGIESLDIRMDTNTIIGPPIKFEMSGFSSEGDLGALGLEMNGLNETQTAALKSLGDALNLFTKGIVDNFKDTIPRFVKELKAEANKPDPNVIRADQEGQVSMTRAAENDQAEIGKLNAMSTPEFAQALQADPSLARHLPQINPSSPARQEYENFVASQPPMSRQAATEGFYEMVKQSVINENLVEAGLMTDEPADNVEAAPDFSDIPGFGTTGAAPAGAASGLPQVALSSLSHLVPLSAEAVQQGKTMEGLQAHMRNVEYNIENLDFLATGTALLRFENAQGAVVPANFTSGAASLSLNVDLPVVKQWVAKFVGDGAPDQANLPFTQVTALQQALDGMPDDAASATDAQRSALTTAMVDCLKTITYTINTEARPRYEAA